MNKYEIFEKIAQDLKIKRGDDEIEVNYLSRIVYSAISIHIRMSILDRNFSKVDHGKSKIYVKEKCEKILKSFIDIYPDLRDWFYVDENPVGLIRDRLQDVGEFINIEFNNSIYLPIFSECYISDQYKVLRGLDVEKMNNISGIIMIKYANKGVYDRLEVEKFYNSNIERKKNKLYLYLNSNMEEIQSTENFEFFNKYMKRKLSKSWESDLNINENDITIYKLNNQNYGFIKKNNGKLYKKTIDEYDINSQEIRRYMFNLKAKCNNKMPYYVEYKGDNYVYLSLASQVPKEEAKILNTFGWPIDSIKGRKFMYKKEIWSYIESILENLELRKVEKSGQV